MIFHLRRVKKVCIIFCAIKKAQSAKCAISFPYLASHLLFDFLSIQFISAFFVFFPFTLLLHVKSCAWRTFCFFSIILHFLPYLCRTDTWEKYIKQTGGENYHKPSPIERGKMGGKYSRFSCFAFRAVRWYAYGRLKWIRFKRILCSHGDIEWFKVYPFQWISLLDINDIFNERKGSELKGWSTFNNNLCWVKFASFHILKCMLLIMISYNKT